MIGISDYDRENLASILAGEGDWFTAMLLRVIAKADYENREKLRRVFPHEVAAVQLWQERGGP